MKFGHVNFVWNPTKGEKDPPASQKHAGWALVAMMVIAFCMGAWAQSARAAETRGLSDCREHLAWQRWDYTKAHYNVTQSLRGKPPEKVNWRHPSSVTQCTTMITDAKKLRAGEVRHWKKVRLSREGVKWIIRRQFSKAGPDAVYYAWKVVSCESSFRWYAYNGADSGPWQINYVHHVPKYIMFSPELSTGWAWRASSHGTDFSPTWTCATLRGIR